MDSLSAIKTYVDWMITLGNKWQKENLSEEWVEIILTGLHKFRVDQSQTELRVHTKPHLNVYFNTESSAPEGLYFLLRPPSKRSSRTIYLLRPRVCWEEGPVNAWSPSCDALLRMCVNKELDNGSQKVYHYGQRFEGPEQPGERNATPHVQMLHDGVDNLWINHRIPATPIRADEPHEIILCALAGVYGARELNDLANISGLKGTPRKYLKSYLGKIGFKG
jgi:hypothetical protein